jgi:hypothetical protein
VTKKLDRAASLIDQAATRPARQAHRLLRKAKRALKLAVEKVARAAKGTTPTLSPECAAALEGAVEQAIARLGV